MQLQAGGEIILATFGGDFYANLKANFTTLEKII